MKTMVYHEKKYDLDLEYYFYKSQNPSDVLIVSFPAPGRGMRGGTMGYVLTLRKFKDVHLLFPLTNPEYSKSRMTYRNGEPEIETAVMGVVEQCIRETKATHIIAVGSSMGGWCAMYYGLKHGWDIISGSPPYTFGNKVSALYAMGDASDENLERMNTLLESVIRDAGKRGYQGKIFVSWGDAEPLWKKSTQGPKMVKDLTNAGIPFFYELYPFAYHQTICELFPHVLTGYLGYFLGIHGHPRNNGKDLLESPETRLLNTIDEILGETVHQGNKEGSLAPSLDIQNCAHYGSMDSWTALRNYVYIKQGWYWGEGKNFFHPMKIPQEGNFWNLPRIDGNRNILDFYFQTTLLEYYEKCKEKGILEWLEDNVSQYFRRLEEIGNAPFTVISARETIIRASFFIRFHQIFVKSGMESECLSEVPSEIRRFTELVRITCRRPTGAVWRYRIALMLLHLAVYFRRHEEFCSSLSTSALKITNALNDYYFDKTGVCIGGQFDWHDLLLREIFSILSFIKANQLETDKNLFRRLQRMNEAILKSASHISLPDGRLVPIGHTASILRRTRRLAPRSATNFIAWRSNLAFLESPSSQSYLTVGGGSNIHTMARHCDLLSFTWWYDGKQIFCDTGGSEMENLSEHAMSAVAHNAFLCDDFDYVTPDYEDWTTMDEDGVEETEQSVKIVMGHHLIDGVEMKRTFLWIKPNIVFLVDEGISEEEHKYTQNFLLEDFPVDKSNPGQVVLKIAPQFYGILRQYPLGNTKILLEEYRGTTNVDDEAHFRGSLIENWRTLRKGLNLAYTKTGKGTVRFLASIELHSPKREGKEEELAIQSLRYDKDGNYEIKCKKF